MKPYPKTRPSGVEWLGDVPEYWQVKRLKMAVKLIDRKVEAVEDDLLPYIGMEDIESGTGQLLPIDPDRVPAGVANAFKKGNVLFGKLRPYLAKACTPNFDGLCSTELLVLEGLDFDRNSLRYALLSEGFIDLVNSSTYGSKMPRASWNFIGDCVLPIAPQQEQTAIVAYLDRETGRIDALVGKNRELIERLKEKRSALIARTVTRGLPADLPPETLTKLEEIAGEKLPLDPPLKPSGIDWLGDVPAHWDSLSVRRRAKRIQTGSTPPTAEDRFYGDGTVPWFGPGSFDDQIVLTQPIKLLNPAAVEEGAARVFAAGATMVVSIGATLGKVSGLTDSGSCNQQITVIEFDQRHIYPRFATYQLKRLESVLRAVAPSATLPILDQGHIADLPLCFPPLPEQRSIAAYLDQETARIDALVAKVETVIERLQEYRSALITAAVTGKIDIREAVEA